MNITQRHHLGVRADAKSNRSVLFIHPLKPALFLRESSPHEDGFQIDPLSLDYVKFGKVLIYSGESFFKLLDLIGETIEKPAFLERCNQTLVVAYLGDDLLPLFDEWSLATVRFVVC